VINVGVPSREELKKDKKTILRKERLKKRKKEKLVKV